MNWHKNAARFALFGCLGFFLGIFGISFYSKQSSEEILQLLFSKPTKEVALSNACMNEEHNDERIYFISCGGIY